MINKAVYVLISSENDYYSEQLLLSVYTLKRHNRDISCELICDNPTLEHLKSHLPLLLSEINEVKAVDFPVEIDGLRRSRSLKTSLPDYIDGDFIYLDTDTVILNDITSADAGVANMAAVEDHHQPSLMTCGYLDWLMSKMNRIGWGDFPLEMPYYNSGVLVVRNTRPVRAFFSRWHQIWKFTAENDLPADQPALNYVNNEYPLIEKLAPEYHCQLLGNGLKYLLRARIVHYFNASKWGIVGEKPIVLMEYDLMREIRKEGKIPERIKAILDENRLFPDRVELVSGNAVPVYRSNIFNVLVRLQIKYPKLFNCLNKLALRI